MQIYLTLDAARFFVVPDDASPAPGTTLVRRLISEPAHVDLDALAQWEVPREEGLALARAALPGDALGRFEAQVLALQESLAEPATRERLTALAATLKKLGTDARARRADRARKKLVAAANPEDDAP